MHNKHKKEIIYAARGNGKSNLHLRRMLWLSYEPPKWKIFSYLKWLKEEPRYEFVEVDINDIFGDTEELND